MEGPEKKGEGPLKSLDGVTSPVSFTEGPDDSIELVLHMSRAGFESLTALSDATGEDLETVFRKSLGLYRKLHGLRGAWT